MYGLILENIASYLKAEYGEEIYKEILFVADIHNVEEFESSKIYSETLAKRMVCAAQEVTGESLEKLMESIGYTFCEFTARYGYDKIIRILGRRFTDFMNVLDNLHEYLRFTYPKLKPPSFYCENESRTGLTLHYRSKRRGFLHYVKGQIMYICKTYYGMDVKLELLDHSNEENTDHVIFRLHFNNVDFDKALIWYLNNVFELMSIEPIWDTGADSQLARSADIAELENERRRLSEAEKSKYLTLKGQMIYIEEWESICFLGNPIVVDLTQMHRSGLFINDFAMHDSSRDLVLTSTLQAAELKLLLDQEAHKGDKLKESMQQLKSARAKTDELLYQLLPKSVADKLRKGASAVDTCETFESVTMLFTDIVGFTTICAGITPMSVVDFLNHMYSVFDALTEKHGVFKVETIGDAYMIVGGAPVRSSYHPEYTCDCALSIMESVRTMVEATSNTSIRIRAGVHTGNVVAGVVGLQMPRYCLFGENVTIANKMESTGTPMQIQVSQATKDALDVLVLKEFEFKFNKIFDLPNAKSQLKTYWLVKKNGPPRHVGCPLDGEEGCAVDPQFNGQPDDQCDLSRPTSRYSPIGSVTSGASLSALTL